MSLTTIISELWRFFKDNILRILLGALLVAFLTVGGRYLISNYLFADQKESADYLAEIYKQEPASFKAVVTIEDGQLFSNAHLYDDYFTTPAVVAAVEEETGVAIQETLDHEQVLELFKSPSFRGSIGGVRDAASGVFIFRFLVAENAEDNLRVAQAYRDILINTDIPFAENHTINIVVEPAIGEMLDIEEVTSLANPEVLDIYQSENVPSMVIYGVLGFVIGIILMTFFFFLLRLRKTKIAYAFEYAWDMNDQHVIIDNKSDTYLYSLKNAIRTPLLSNRWIISQNPLADKAWQKSSSDGEMMVADLGEMADLDQGPKQIVIIVSANHTDKSWYKEQLALAKLYNVPVKIIHT